nr:immunoglobulin heavy chain junction region [Macaca mulatta]MOW46960.1 immunoglobulin heavy chain junction region [Macaca mulatta]
CVTSDLGYGLDYW